MKQSVAAAGATMIFLTLLGLTSPSDRALAQAYQAPSSLNDDLVVPNSSEADQDAISDELQKKANGISDENAQKGTKPKEEEHYIRLMPSEDVDQPPEVEEKRKNGTKIYKTKIPEEHHLAGVRVGSFNPTNLQGDQAGITYNEIYGNGAIEADFFYEWDFFRSFGKLAAKADLGLFTGKGNGRFEHTPTEQANEILTLLGLPLEASAVYHLQYWRRQLFVPFAEIGADYIPFFEIRSDLPSISQDIKYGGAPAWHAAGGFQLQLDFLDPDGVWGLYEEYGITHIYLTFDVRQIFGLSTLFNFTTLMYEGGFAFEF